MIQPSLSFLALPIPAAMKVLGSLRTLDHLPDLLQDGVIDMIIALTNCFPEVSEDYYERMNQEKDFNHAEAAYKVLAPAVEKVSYPLQTPHGLMDEDTPLTSALTGFQGMELLFSCLGVLGAAVSDAEVDALLIATDKLVEADPWVAAEFDRLMNDSEASFDYCGAAYRLLCEAKLRNDAQLPIAA